jgi:hypothetical protein
VKKWSRPGPKLLSINVLWNLDRSKLRPLLVRLKLAPRPLRWGIKQLIWLVLALGWRNSYCVLKGEACFETHCIVSRYHGLPVPLASSATSGRWRFGNFTTTQYAVPSRAYLSSQVVAFRDRTGQLSIPDARDLFSCFVNISGSLLHWAS